MFIAYKYRIYPTIDQAKLIQDHFGACRFVCNWALEQKINTYQQIGKSISQFDLCEKLTTLKHRYPWLKEVNAQSLQEMTQNLETTFTKFFREQKSDSQNLNQRKIQFSHSPFPKVIKLILRKELSNFPRLVKLKLLFIDVLKVF